MESFSLSYAILLCISNILIFQHLIPCFGSFHFFELKIEETDRKQWLNQNFLYIPKVEPSKCASFCRSVKFQIFVFGTHFGTCLFSKIQKSHHCTGNFKFSKIFSNIKRCPISRYIFLCVTNILIFWTLIPCLGGCLILAHGRGLFHA